MQKSLWGRRALVALAASVVGGMVVLGLSAPAFAVQTDTLTVKLTSKAGVPLVGYEVYPVDVADGNESTFDSPDEATPVTGKPGYYTVSVVDGDSYTLAMYPGGTALNSATLQYLGGTATLNGATLFTPNSAEYFLAASIATGGTISGKVTGPTNAALKGATVESYFFDGTDWNAAAVTTTSSTGAYTFANVVPGTYKLRFDAPGSVYPAIYSGGATTLDAAAASYLAAGSTVAINQRFSVGTGSISGTSYLSSPGDYPSRFDYYDSTMTPVAYRVTSETAYVVYTQPTAIDLANPIVGSASSATGTWSIKNLPAGDYVVQVVPHYWGEAAAYIPNPNAFDYVGEDSPFDAAQVFTVTAGQTTKAGSSDFVYDTTQDGTAPVIDVRDYPGNVGIPGVQVSVSPVRDPQETFSGIESDTSTVVSLFDSAGKLVTENSSQGKTDNALVPGWYTVTVIDPSGGHLPYKAVEWFGLGTPGFDIQLSVAGPDDVPGFTVDASIAETGTVVGTTYQVAETLNPSGNTATYQWLRDGRAIFGATSISYTSVGADVGHQLSVRVGAKLFGFATVYEYASVGGNETPTITTIGDQVTNATLPTITPSTGIYPGTTVTADVGTWTIDGLPVSGLTYSYAWSVGGTPVPSATGSSYVVQQGDATQGLSVSIVASKLGYTSSDPAVSINEADPTTHPAAALKKAPALSRKVVHGVTTYAVSTGTWNVSGLSFSYDWLLGTTEVSTASSVTSTQIATVLPAPGALTVTVTAHKLGYSDGQSAPILAVKGTTPFTQVFNPTIEDVTAGQDVGGDTTLPFGDHLVVAAPGEWPAVNLMHPSGYTYQWFRNGVAIKGATTSGYTIGTADLASGNTTVITVAETAVSAFYQAVPSPQYEVGLGAYRLMGQPTAAFSSQTTDSGTGDQHSEDGLTDGVTLGSWGGITGVTVAYQWFDCPDGSTCVTPSDDGDYLPIAGANKSALAMKAAYAYVFLRVTGTKVGYLPFVWDFDRTVVDPAYTVTNMALPTIGGTATAIAHVGVKLTAGAGRWSVASPSISYSWQTQDCTAGLCDDSLWTPVATTSTYTPTPTDYATGGRRIRLVVTAGKLSTQFGPIMSTSVSADYAVGLGSVRMTGAPKVTGTSSYFRVTSVGTYSPSAGSASAQWFVDGVPDGTSDPTHTRNLALEAGAAIYATVTYSLPGYADVVTRVIAQRGVTLYDNGEQVVGGTQLGDTLSASELDPFQDAQDSVRAMSYQWYSNGVAVKGATHPTLLPNSGYVGKRFQLKVTGTTPLYADRSVETTAVTLQSGVFATASNPQITTPGATQPGAVLTAVPDTVDYGTTGIAFRYQWQVSTNSGLAWSSIAKATNATYVPAATQVTDELRVIVTATKAGYLNVGLTSDPSTVAYSPTLDTITPPSIIGSDKVGGLLTTTTGVWNAPGLTFAYQWFRDGVAIPGATTNSWTPTVDSLGDDVSVAVTARAGGYQPVTVDSQDISVALADPPVATVAPAIARITSLGVTSYTVSTGSWNVDGLTYAYQWKVAGVDGIGSGATTPTYIPDPSETGLLTVEITVTRAGYTPVPTITMNYPISL